MAKETVYMTGKTKPSVFEITVDKNIFGEFFYHLYIWCQETECFKLTKSSNLATDLIDLIKDDGNQKAIIIDQNGHIFFKQGNIDSVIVNLSTT